MAKQPKIKLVVQASKRQQSLGMFDEVRVVLIQTKRERPVKASNDRG